MPFISNHQRKIWPYIMGIFYRYLGTGLSPYQVWNDPSMRPLLTSLHQVQLAIDQGMREGFLQQRADGFYWLTDAGRASVEHGYITLPVPPKEPMPTTNKPNSSPCTDFSDCIAERCGNAPVQYVARCLHGTTSQGDSRPHAIKMALEACALVHGAEPPSSNRTLDITLPDTTWAKLESLTTKQNQTRTVAEVIEDLIDSWFEQNEPDPSVPAVRKFA